MRLKAAVVQYTPAHGRPRVNILNLLAQIDFAADKGAALVLLPEMCWTGYLWPDEKTLKTLAEPAAKGMCQDLLRQAAMKYKIFLGYGYPELCADGLYNAQGLWGPDGVYLAHYQKTHLYEADTYWARPGKTGFVCLETKIGRLGLGICMDFNYADIHRFHQSRETEIFLFSTNWIDEGINVHQYWRNQLGGFAGYCLASNRGGSEFGVPFCGQSAVFKGDRLIASLNHKDDAVLLIDLEF